MEYPDFVAKKLEEISKRTDIPLEQVQKEYENFFNSDFIRDDSQFADDDERHRYAKGVFWTRYILRKPVKAFNFIPIGMDSVRKGKSTGLLNTAIFALDDKGKLSRISLKGDVCKSVKDITLFSMYKGVQLGEFKDSADLIADDRAEFKNPIQVNMDPKQLVDTLNIEYTTVIDANRHLSKIDSTGYVDKTDWKAVRGFIQRANKSGPDSDSEWGVYTIVDETVDPEKIEPEVTPSGEILPPGFSVWISPNLMNYGRESECVFLGTITKDTKGKISMNCYSVVPLYVHVED